MEKLYFLMLLCTWCFQVSITKAEKLFRSQYGRKPNSHELSERLALPVQKVELLVKCSREVRSYIHTYIHTTIQKYKHDFPIDIIIIFFARRWSLSTTRSTSRAASRKTTKCMWRTASPRSRPSRPCWMKGTPCGRSCAMPCSTSLSARRKLWRCDSVWQAARQWLWKKSVCMYVGINSCGSVL